MVLAIEDKFKRMSKKIWSKFEIDSEIEERALTSYVVGKLKSTNSKHFLAIKGQNEKVKGADIEWWIIFPGNANHKPHAMHMRIQAKRLHMKEDIDHRYDDLDHKKGKQLNDLINHSRLDNAIPLYCFYNRYLKTNSNSYTKASFNPIDDGWRYAFADDIATKRTTSPNTFRNLSIIDPLTKAMHTLAFQTRTNPGAILNEYKSVTAGMGIDYSKLCRDQLPDYAFEAMEDYQFPNHKFVKETDWFRNISACKKKNKEEKGKRNRKAMFQTWLRNLMNFLSLNQRKRQNHLIIVVAMEPINNEDFKRN